MNCTHKDNHFHSIQKCPRFTYDLCQHHCRTCGSTFVAYKIYKYEPVSDPSQALKSRSQCGYRGRDILKGAITCYT